MINRLLFSLSGAFVISFAAYGYVAPDRCPAADVIQSAGFDEVKLDTQLNTYFAVKKSTYGTNFQWDFSYGFFQGTSIQMALAEAEHYLTRIYGNPEPVNYRNHSWTCTYLVSDNYWATAVTTGGTGKSLT